MSTIVMAACWPLQMPATQKAVLISLADNANDHGVCWPSIPKICERTCLKRTAVIDAIQALERCGLLTVDRSTGTSNRYQLTPAADLFQPVRQTDQSAKRTGSPAGPHPSATRTAPVRQTDPNRKEPSRTASKDKALDFSTWPSEPSPQVLADWLAHRKAKRALVTDTVIEAFGRELHKAKAMGWSVDDCLAEAMQRNWQGFNADWLQPSGNRNQAPAPSKSAQALMNLEGLKRGNRMAAGRDIDGAAEALPALAGPNARR